MLERSRRIEGTTRSKPPAISVSESFVQCVDGFDSIEAVLKSDPKRRWAYEALHIERRRFLQWSESFWRIAYNPKLGYNQLVDGPELSAMLIRIPLCVRDMHATEREFNGAYWSILRDCNLYHEDMPGILTRICTKFKARAKSCYLWKGLYRKRYMIMIGRVRGLIDDLIHMAKSLEGFSDIQDDTYRTDLKTAIEGNNSCFLSSYVAVDEKNASMVVSSLQLSHRMGEEDMELDGETLRSLTPSDRSLSSSTTPTRYDIASSLASRECPLQNPSLEKIYAIEAKYTEGIQSRKYLPREHAFLAIPIASGQNIAQIQARDLHHARETLTSGNVAVNSVERSIMRRLSEFAKDPIPFISLTPLDDNILDLLGSVEGPPGSPYQGGIFYIRIAIPPRYPFQAPICQFLTKIYHPNIDARGLICLGVLGSGWDPKHGRLEKLLLAMCALLEDPAVEDPLVPEIAQTFLLERDRYNRNARSYTKRFANGVRPVVAESFEDFFASTERSYTIMNSGQTNLALTPFPATLSPSATRLRLNYLDSNVCLLRSLALLWTSTASTTGIRSFDHKMGTWQNLAQALLCMNKRLSLTMESVSKSQRILLRLEEIEYCKIQSKVKELINCHTKDGRKPKPIMPFVEYPQGAYSLNSALWTLQGASKQVLRLASSAPKPHSEPPSTFWRNKLSSLQIRPISDRRYHIAPNTEFSFWFELTAEEGRISYPLQRFAETESIHPSQKWLTPRAGGGALYRYIQEVGIMTASKQIEGILEQAIEELEDNALYHGWISPQADQARWKAFIKQTGKEEAITHARKFSTFINDSGQGAEWDKILHDDDLGFEARRSLRAFFIGTNLPPGSLRGEWGKRELEDLTDQVLAAAGLM
ncbi:MAG: hypothetical protein M1827_005412 [Pycnora praestabilis]|nr:MAG: hypothetical protein M1827_005412 [Pycnora praestabilis]